MDNKLKIILDTDIGDDIDDAFALQYAIKHPKIDLLGVTTVYKNVYERACMAKCVLVKNNREDIGVYMGEDFPLEEALKPFLFEKKNDKDRHNILSWESFLSNYKVEEEKAVDFILRKIKELPNEIVLVGIGPLTNIAKAFIKEPETMKKLKGIVLMCGNIGNVYEWNIMCDPEAANVVLCSGLPITCVGSNCTEQCYFEQKDLLEYLDASGEAIEYINSMMQKWIIYNMRPPIMHDGLALSEAINNYVDFQTCDIDVPLRDKRRGMTICTPNSNGRIKMSVNVDRKGFMAHFMEIVLKP